MQARALTALLTATALAAPVALTTDASGAAKRPPEAAKKHRLAAFDDCRELVSYARRHAARVEPYYSAVGFTVGRGGIDEVGRTNHDWPGYPAEVERSVAVGDRLFTVSGLGVKANDLGTFADAGRAEFPQPPRPEYPPCADCAVAVP